jgi:hypothetical protein
MVQATGKTQPGGVQLGFLSEAYQSPGMNEAPDEAAIRTSAAKIMSDPMFRNGSAPGFSSAPFNDGEGGFFPFKCLSTI